MRRGTPRRSEQNQSLDEEIGKIPEQLPEMIGVWRPSCVRSRVFQETEHLTAWSILSVVLTLNLSQYSEPSTLNYFWNMGRLLQPIQLNMMPVRFSLLL